MSQLPGWRYVADDEVVFHEDVVLGRRYRMVVSSGRVERQWFGEWVPSDADPLVMFAGRVRIA